MSEINKIRKCLGLLNSMIASGENHSMQSRAVLEDARNALAEIEKEIEYLKERLHFEQNKLPCIYPGCSGKAYLSGMCEDCFNKKENK